MIDTFENQGIYRWRARMCMLVILLLFLKQIIQAIDRLEATVGHGSFSRGPGRGEFRSLHGLGLEILGTAAKAHPGALL